MSRKLSWGFWAVFLTLVTLLVMLWIFLPDLARRYLPPNVLVPRWVWEPRTKSQAARREMYSLKAFLVNSRTLGFFEKWPPTPEALRELEPDREDSRFVDPWGNDYRISLNGSNVVVTSAGRDGALDTRDDLVVQE